MNFARRLISTLLLVLGGILIFLAPEDIWIGAILAVLGITLELVALTLRHHRKRKSTDSSKE